MSEISNFRRFKKFSLKIACIYGAITTTKKGAIPLINSREIDSFL